MELNPVNYFRKWFEEELRHTKVSIPTACCLSTMGTDGFPNARFVSLKDIVEDNFIVTGTLTSRKGQEIATNNRVALTFWWTDTERQVRIQGYATRISEQEADKYFSARDRESQIVSIVSEQGQELFDAEMLNEKYQDIEREFAGRSLERPNNWGGYFIDPVRIEFLEFKSTRFHNRKLFERVNENWSMKALQP